MEEDINAEDDEDAEEDALADGGTTPPPLVRTTAAVKPAPKAKAVWVGPATTIDGIKFYRCAPDLASLDAQSFTISRVVVAW